MVIVDQIWVLDSAVSLCHIHVMIFLQITTRNLFIDLDRVMLLPWPADILPLELQQFFVPLVKVLWLWCLSNHRESVKEPFCSGSASIGPTRVLSRLQICRISRGLPGLRRRLLSHSKWRIPFAAACAVHALERMLSQAILLRSHPFGVQFAHERPLFILVTEADAPLSKPIIDHGLRVLSYNRSSFEFIEFAVDLLLFFVYCYWVVRDRVVDFCDDCVVFFM